MLVYEIYSGPVIVAKFMVESSRSGRAFCSWVRAYCELERSWNPTDQIRLAVAALVQTGYGVESQEGESC